MSIYVTRSSMPDIEEYMEEIKPIFDSHTMTNMGPVYKKFQHLLISFLEVPYLSLFVNGHMALEMALQAMDLPKGGEVITSPYTFVSTTHAIVRNGLKPVFCDIDPVTYTLDPTKIEECITENTVAIVPIHVYGNICDVEAIDAIAKKNNLKVVYDAAHAFGIKYKGVGIGNYGDASMFSFHATKVFNSIEGGGVAFRDMRYRQRLHELKNFGIHGADDIASIGGNAKLDEFRAAMGICNLRRMDICITSRKKAYDRYMERLSGVEGIRLNSVQENVSPNYAYFPAYFDESIFGKNRDEIFDLLRKHDIHTRKYFYPAVNDATCYKDFDTGYTPVARDIAAHILTLPMYEELQVEEVDQICDIIIGSRQ